MSDNKEVEAEASSSSGKNSTNKESTSDKIKTFLRNFRNPMSSSNKSNLSAKSNQSNKSNHSKGNSSPMESIKSAFLNMSSSQRGERSSAEKPAVGLIEAAFLSISLNGKREENKRSFAPILRAPAGNPGHLSPRQLTPKLLVAQQTMLSSQQNMLSSAGSEPCFTAPSRNSKSTILSTVPSEINGSVDHDHDNDNATINSEDTGMLTMNDRRCMKAQILLTGGGTTEKSSATGHRSLSSRTFNDNSAKYSDAPSADDPSNNTPPKSPLRNSRPSAYDEINATPSQSPLRSPRFADASDVMSVSSAASGISEASCLTRASTMNNSEMIPNAWIHAGKRSTIPPILKDDPTPIVPADGMVSVLFAGKTRKGVTPSNPDKPNQDAFFMKHDSSTSSLIIACFDGHGQCGHDVSRYCKHYLERYLCFHPLFHCDVKMAVMETISTLEREMLAAPHIDTLFSGTTMVLIILRGTKVYVANLGDSRVVLGHRSAPLLTRTTTETSDTTHSGNASNSPSRQYSPMLPSDYSYSNSPSPRGELLMAKYCSPRSSQSPPDDDYMNDESAGQYLDNVKFNPPTTVQLSIDHKPNIPNEQARIRASGGRVKVVHDTARVYLATDDIPGLAMSRSLGDFVAHSVGVSSVPEFFEYDLSEVCSSSLNMHGRGRYTGDYNASGKIYSNIGGTNNTQIVMRSVLLIGTDGVYDMISNDDAVDLAFKYWGDPAAATDAIVSHTGQNWMARWGIADDTTVCIVNLEHTTYLQTPQIRN